MGAAGEPTKALKLEKVEDEDEDEGDFFKEKNDHKDAQKKVKTVEEEEASDEEEAKVLPDLSKRAMRKIREEGPYAGKNKIKFDGEGKV